MRATRIGLLIPIFAAAVAVAVPAQQAAQSVPTIHVTSRIVVLDVVVSDGRSHPVKGLTAADFAIKEDGVPQTILSVTEHDAAAADQPAPPSLPPNTFTVQPPVAGEGAKTVIVLGGFSPIMRNELKDYFTNSTPTMPMAIFRIDWQGMHLVQGFTMDRAVLLEAVTSKRIWPPLGFPVRYARSAGSPTQHLARYLAGVSGRINVIWFGGISVGELEDAFPDLPDFVHDLNGVTDVRRLARMSLYTVDVSGPRVGAGIAFANVDLDDMVTKMGGRSFRYTAPKSAIAQVVATGSHYYTVSYRPSNPNWDGKFRNIHLDVDGFDQPPMTLRWSQLITGWAEGFEPRLIYRRGYFATDKPPVRNHDFGGPVGLAETDSGNGLTPQRRLISVSPRAKPVADQKAMEEAMGFATPTPFQVHFSVVVTPSEQKEKTKPGEDLPAGNYLTGAFRDGAYRNYAVHYWVDPRDLRFLQTAPGSYRDDLQFVIMVYRDDGLAANSVAYAAHIEVHPEDLTELDTSGVTADQTVAIPTDGNNYFLRVGVNEVSSGHLGALEVPAEWIKAAPAQDGVAAR